MATLSGQRILVVGGTSGIGFAVAKLSLLSVASHVIVVSSSASKVEGAVSRLQAIITENKLSGRVTGDVLDASDTVKVQAYVKELGEIDHLVWTSGDPLKLGFPNIDLERAKGAFDVRFWGAVAAAQVANIRPGGSIILTVGTVVVKPGKSWSIAAGVAGAVDSLTRGLAVDLAPIRVNVISPGAIDTELWDSLPPAVKEKRFEDVAAQSLVKRIGEADAVAEAYLFCMKCNYITGQRIEVDGGARYA